jgi:spore coat protein U-like protein
MTHISQTEVDNLVAGTYSDTIIVTLTPKDNL